MTLSGVGTLCASSAKPKQVSASEPLLWYGSANSLASLPSSPRFRETETSFGVRAASVVWMRQLVGVFAGQPPFPRNRNKFRRPGWFYPLTRWIWQSSGSRMAKLANDSLFAIRPFRQK
jgi:hypothetical protein